MDVGTEDEFGFGRHYDNPSACSRPRASACRCARGYQGDCTDIAKPDAPFYLLRYPGGHVGIPESDSVLDDLLNGDVRSAAGIWERLTSVLGYLDASFPDGNYGVGKVIDLGDLGDLTSASSTCAATSSSATSRRRRCSSPAATSWRSTC